MASPPRLTRSGDGVAMTTSWERRIRHIDRKVKPTAMAKLGLRSQLLKAKVKERRGLPSRNLPADLVFERIRLKIGRQAESLEAADRLDRLRRREMHERLMERKRNQRRAAYRRARPSSADTRINLWRRRQQWLREVEEAATTGLGGGGDEHDGAGPVP